MWKSVSGEVQLSLHILFQFQLCKDIWEFVHSYKAPPSLPELWCDITVMRIQVIYVFIYLISQLFIKRRQPGIVELFSIELILQECRVPELLRLCCHILTNKNSFSLSALNTEQSSVSLRTDRKNDFCHYSLA